MNTTKYQIAIQAYKWSSTIIVLDISRITDIHWVTAIANEP
jgi:hypothetical protein